MTAVDAMTSAPENGVVVRAPLRARVSWMLFDWAAQPYYTLVQTFLFAPYFANMVANSPTHGQTMWGYAAAIAGLMIAIISPFLGAVADGHGRRKLWMLILSLVFLTGLCTLWLAVPGASSSTIFAVLTGFVLATIAAELMTVFSNAIMTGLAPKDELGRLSGTGWAVGYFGGLASLALVAGLLVPLPGQSQTLLGLTPLLTLDAASHQGDRLTGPFAAAWFVIFILPFFLFVPDRRATKAPMHTERSPTAELWDTIKSLPALPSLMIFLIARMLYTDGLTAIFTFGGIYGASVFNWGPTELGIFGIVLTLVGAIGALIGGRLDDKLGAKTVIIGSLVILLVAATGILSVDKTHVLYSVAVPEKLAGSAPFSSTGERVFLAFAIIVGLVAAPVQAASRSLLARIAPADKITQFFGLFAFSGKVTAFLAPFLVAFVTQVSDSQRIGMSAVLAFLIVGGLMMLFVRVKPAPSAT
ncbi:MAG: MFS transporter [Hyphomicrobiaceae bacterium]|nr:MFS transporter [Hyphomicrobiaceae bacterium]